MKSKSVNPTTDQQGQRGAFPLAAGSGLRRITPLAKSAAKRFCTYTRQEDSTEDRLAEIIQDVIELTQRAMATGAKLAHEMESEAERCESGCKEPVAGHDSEGIPLCQACLDDLAREDDPNISNQPRGKS